MDTANAACPAYVVTLLFFSGFLIRLDKIPAGWYWYSKISFMGYAWGALMVDQFEGKNTTITTETESGERQEFGVLDFYDLDKSANFYTGWIFAFFGAFFILVFLTLTSVRHQRR